MRTFTATSPAALAAASLPAGFAVADVTGVRPIGGAVFAGLGLASLLVARPSPLRGAALIAVALGSFAASHALADGLGKWGAVASVTAVTGAAAAWLLRRRP